MTDAEMTSLTALRDWCRDACACYHHVEIKNMSASFRDGLAFCAIIHKHRPDLIDFSSLSRDNSYQNNQLAFETAEKLGIPALLNPKDLASSEVPDALGVLTYLSWYYCFFSGVPCAGLASLGTSHVTDVKQLPRTKTPDGPKCDEGSDRRELHRGLVVQEWSKTKVPVVCPLCLKPIQLIQRRLVDGKIYHRSCLRCGVCHCTLLPQWCTQRGDSSALVCSHHPAHVQVTEPEVSAPAENRVRGSPQAVRFLGSTTGYTESTQSAATLASEAADAEEKGREVTDAEGPDSTAAGQRSADPSGSPDPPAPAASEEAAPGPLDTHVFTCPPELSTCTQEQIGKPDPTPGCEPSPSFIPKALPSASTPQTTNSSLAAEKPASLCSCSDRLQRSSSTSNIRLRLNHPWLTIIHPGPWTQLPAAPPPARSLQLQRRPRVSAPNPFERVDEEAKPQKAAATQVGKGTSGGGVGNPAVPSPVKPHGGSGEIVAGVAHESGNRKEARAGIALSQQPHLPRSLSVPALKCSIPPPERPKSVCREADGEQKSALAKSFHTPRSSRAPPPGFPLIKRKVQTDHNICPGSLQVEVKNLDKQLEAMERRGVELEKNLRHSGDEEKEEMLMEWFALNHERHVLVRRDMELGYVMMQQKLEERQADVEYELRRLLGNQENEWTEEERGEERQLMEELVSLVEQRNQIICSLDQDVLREREEDKLLKATLNSKELQKEGIKEMRRSKGKLNPGKVFKLLHQRAAASVKRLPDKRS